MTAPLVFIDTETFGLDADVHKVWEIGAVFEDGTEWHTFIRHAPRDVDLAHPVALEIGRYHERYDEKEALSESLVALFLSNLPQGCHLVGAVVSFDEERLRRMLWEYAYPVPWHYHLIDVEALAVGFLAGQAEQHASPPTVRPPWKSDDLSRELGVDPDQFEKHTALGDARWARAMYQAVMSS